MSSSQKKLRIGFIGTGFIGKFHLQALQSVREFEVTGVLKRSNSEEFANMSEKLGTGSPKIYNSISELAKNSDVICVYVPNKYTLETIQEIALAKASGADLRGLICDKPLGRNLAEARKIVETVKKAGLLTAYFENQIFMPMIQAQREQLAMMSQKMGPLSLVRSSEEHAGPHMSWFWDPREQGGGVLNDMGCHSIAVSWYCLTPYGKPIDFLKPVSVSCELGLLKWGQPGYREKLLSKSGVDYGKTPAEDFATGIVTFQNPETKQKVKAQFTDSWMYDKQGLRIGMDGLGPGYAFEINTLLSSLNIFIGDEAEAAIKDQELALEKSTASRGLLAVQANEADLYGYVNENRDAARAFLEGKDALLPLSYGLEITKLVMASYMAFEKKKIIDLTDPQILKELETYVPLIQQGRGLEIL